MGNPTRILGGSGHPAFYWALNEMAETHDRKNQDYANPTDPFANFRACEKAGISMVDGIYTRMSDKWERITNLIAKQRKGGEPAVAESLEDTLIDLANYAIILRIALNEQESQGTKSEESIHQFCIGNTHSVACPATKEARVEARCEPTGIKLAMDAFHTFRAGAGHNETNRG